MREDALPIPSRFTIARRWEVLAKCVFFAAMAGMLIAFLAGQFWFAFAIVFVAMPSAWLFNIRCYRCAWLAYKEYGTAKGWVAKDQFYSSARSRQLWRLPEQCTKCGAPFIEAANA